MSYTAVRRFQFCAGHRVMNHESKCRNMHGHNYVLYVHARPKKELDDLGRVIDFSVLKARMGDWIDKNWDHGFILHHEDAEVKNALKYVNLQKKCMLPVNPTAENMAHFLLHRVCPEVFRTYQIEVSKIVLWETENCFVEVVLPENDARGLQHLPGANP